MPVLNLTLLADGDDKLEDVTGTAIGVGFVATGVTGAANIYDSTYRFAGVDLPAYVTIESAIITFTAAANQAGNNCNTDFFADNNVASAQIADWADYIGRVLTAATVAWDAIAAWTAETTYTSLDLKTIVQELVDENNGLSSGVIHIFWQDGGSNVGAIRQPYERNASVAKSAKLDITYTHMPRSGVINLTPGLSLV